MRDLVIVIRCDGCGTRFESEEALPDSFVTTRVALGKDEREVDLCEACYNSSLAPLRQLIAAGRNIPKKPKTGRTRAEKSSVATRKHAQSPDQGDFRCSEPGCGRRFTTIQGVSLHQRRVHVLATPGKRSTAAKKKR